MTKHLLRLTILLNLAVTVRGADEAPPKLDDILGKARDTRAGMYDSFESSVLGTTASPAEFAATQRDWREHYSRPATTLPEETRRELGKKYGNATIFGAPRSEFAFPLGILGATAIDAANRPELTVTSVAEGTPATGKLQVGDVIVGANGRIFPDWEDPRVPMGYAIAAAQTEAHGGRLRLHVGRDGKIVDAAISVPVAEPYDTEDPFNCPRSREIAQKAVDAVIKKGDDTMFADLFLMGCGDKHALAHVRDRMRKTTAPSKIDNNWAPAYKLVSLCEYYLLTGDKAVLPAIRGYARGLEKNQLGTGGWGHGPNFGYGYMNQVGQVVLIGLALARECGVEIDPVVFSKGVGQLTRFIGTYGAYGDHPPGVSKYAGVTGGDNGKLSAHATLFHVLGESAIARRSARRACYQYRTRTAGHAERIFAIGWSSVGPGLAPRPEYTMYANNMLWYYELARQRDGSLRNLAYTRYRRNTAAVGMTFTLAEKRLRITGKAAGTAPLFPVETLPAKPSSREDAGADTSTTVKETTRKSAEEAAETWDIATLNMTPVTGAPDVAECTFDCKHDPQAYTEFTVNVPAEKGELWLNGQCVAIFPKPNRHFKKPFQTLTLGRRAISILCKGENTWRLRSKMPGKPVACVAALRPAQGKGGPAQHFLPEYRTWRKVNGRGPTDRQQRENVVWAFEEKSPIEIARLLAYPDGTGAHAAYTALAQSGDEASALCRKLVTDSHAGMRIGAWDALAEIHRAKPFSKDVQTELVQIALAQLPKEDPCVGEALCRAVAPMAEGENFLSVLEGVSALPEMRAQIAVIDFARKFEGTPDQVVRVLSPVIASGLEYGDIRALGGAMARVSQFAKNDAAVKALPAIAKVLDDVAPVTRGMFSDGLMHGGLPVVEHQLNPQTAQTPKLVSGLTKCFITCPHTDWPGWARASLHFRRLLYRLDAASADDIRNAANVTQTGSGHRKAEMLVWAELLRRTAGDQEALKKEALLLAESDNPAEREVALSLVWPSKGALMRHDVKVAKDYSDNTRITDPETALKVAIDAAGRPEINSAVAWYMLWETILKHGRETDGAVIIPLLSDYLANHAWRTRDAAFHFRAIDLALVLVKKYASPKQTNPLLAKGLAKTYLTCSSHGWYTGTLEKFLPLIKTMNAESREGIAKGIADVEKWLKTAPEEEKRAVTDRSFHTNLKKRMAELQALAGNQ